MRALNGVGLNFDFDASDFGVLMQGVGDDVYILFTNRGYLTPYTNTGEFDTEFRSQVASDYSLAQATEGCNTHKTSFSERNINFEQVKK